MQLLQSGRGVPGDCKTGILFIARWCLEDASGCHFARKAITATLILPLYLCIRAAIAQKKKKKNEANMCGRPIDYSSQHVQLCANKTPSQMLPNVPLMFRSLFHCGGGHMYF